MYLLNYVGNGGTEKYVLSLISALKPNQCLLVYSTPGPFLEKFKQLNIKTYQVRMNHPFDWKASYEIKKIVQKERVDIIHTQFLRENYIALFSKIFGAKVKVIWTYHVEVEMSPLLKMCNTILTRFNHSIICVSSFMKKQLSTKGVAKKKIEVIYNGIADPYIKQTSINNATKQIAVIGRISKEKGHEFLIKGLVKLRQIAPKLDWHCNIIGTGPLKESIQKQVHKEKLTERISFKGYRDNIIEEYHKNDLIVIPSENESLSYVAIEALALKRPVVATNVGGLPEVIKHDKTGRLVKYGDIDTLAETLQRLLEDQNLTARYIKQGRIYFEENFLLNAMLRKTFRLYNIKKLEVEDESNK